VFGCPTPRGIRNVTDSDGARMTLSILLTTPWDSSDPDTTPRLDVPKVRAHRFSWKGSGTVGIPKSAWMVVPQRRVEGDDGGSTQNAEVITAADDEPRFLKLHGVRAKDANYDELGAQIAEGAYEGLLDVLKEMAEQHPDSMWFVKSWTVETGVDSD
jgi:hypothetical protein